MLYLYNRIYKAFPVALYHAFPDIFHLFACFIVLCWLVAVVVLYRVYVIGCLFIKAFILILNNSYSLYHV